jgi:arginyl-tRNA synthetase
VTIREEIESVLRAALAQEYPSLAGLRFEVLKPREKAFGDFATNIAMLLAKNLGTNPMAAAEKLVGPLRGAPGIGSVEVARPGFINISVSADLLVAKLKEIIDCADDQAFGSSSVGGRRLVQVEFVSANPTGPLNVVSARAAAVGDSLVRLLRRTGHDARSEFYVNDSGTQFELLGRSLEARFREILGEAAEIPENGYPGEYLAAIALKVKDLADWADRETASWATLEEPGAESEDRLVDEFLAEQAAGGRTDLGALKACLSEYTAIKRPLAPEERSLWASLYVCKLSGEPIGFADIMSRLTCLATYHGFLNRAGGAGSGAGPKGRGAAEVFLGRAVRGRRFDFSRFAVEMIVEGQRASLARFGNRPEGGLEFDRWVRESTLKNLIGEVMASLVDDGRFVREKDGAIWLKSGEGDTGDTGEEETDGEKDQWVIRRRTGQPTYFLADIAYHVDKRKRGFERVIDIWGPDHHGHVARMKAGMGVASSVMPGLAIGADWLEILIAQQVNLIRDGKRVQMSKRAGEYVTLDDLVSEVGADAARFFFLMRRSNSHLDFDLDLAKKTSDENPVYYIQYAHARISSIIEYARTSGFTTLPPRADLALLVSEEEVDLIKGLADFDDVVRASALALEPHRLPTYLLDLAGRFHRFYHNHRVVTENRALTEARLCLSWAVRTVLRSGLSLVGVSAPRSM